MRFLAGFITAAVLSGGLAAGAGPERTLIAPGPALIRVTALKVSDHYVGYDHVQTWLLYNRKITQRAIGNEILVCRYIGAGGILGGGANWCQGSVSLPKGRLTFQGRRYSTDFYRQTVAGGTGVYVNVGGELTVTSINAGKARLVFSLQAF